MKQYATQATTDKLNALTCAFQTDRKLTSSETIVFLSSTFDGKPAENLQVAIINVNIISGVSYHQIM